MRADLRKTAPSRLAELLDLTGVAVFSGYISWCYGDGRVESGAGSRSSIAVSMSTDSTNNGVESTVFFQDPVKAIIDRHDASERCDPKIE